MMSNKRIRPIRTESDYQEALVFLEELIDAEPAANTQAAEQLDILSSLIESYEESRYAIDAPDAVEAIKFVMEQRNLEPKDLVPIIGSKSRVSEVLSGKRNLSIEMIRSLESGLGIPSKVLLRKSEPSGGDLYKSWDSKVFDMMKKRGYFYGLSKAVKEKTELLELFFESINKQSSIKTLLRQASYRTSTTDKNALAAWTGFVIKKAEEMPQPSEKKLQIDSKFMSTLAKLSSDPLGPLKARDLLLGAGIKLVIEPAFPKTYIDGATIFTENAPIIGLTLRHDRLDNFWFTLMHEVAHVALHSKSDEIEVFYDEVYERKEDVINDQELEADELASESLIPAASWEISAAHLVPSDITFNLLASELDIHPCIVAGKYRYENKDWKMFSDIIKENKVRHLFREA